MGMPLSGFDRREGELYCEGVSLCAIARKASTPTYVYSGTAIRDNYRSYDTALAGLSHIDLRVGAKGLASLALSPAHLACSPLFGHHGHHL